jgi:hypothetical protein
MWHGAGAQPGAGAACDNRHVERVADAQDLLNLCGAFRKYHQLRQFAVEREGVAFVRSLRLGRSNNAFRAQAGAQAAGEFAAAERWTGAVSKRAPRGGRGVRIAAGFSHSSYGIPPVAQSAPLCGKRCRGVESLREVWHKERPFKPWSHEE